MDTVWQESLGQQFGAAIDMLDNCLRTCPDELWHAQLWLIPDEPTGFTEYWYLAYHTLFWLDLYLSGAVEDFVPPAPFTLDELDPTGLLPERPYTQDELRTYLAHCRQKCQTVIAELTAERARQRCTFGWGEVSFAGLLLYNMRHVQEHAAQLSLFLGQQRGLAARWVATAKSL
jgi:hypothetical protein